MSIIWSGVTEEGAVVPVQVDETGKVIATAAVPGGDYVKKTGDNMTGDLTFDKNITLGINGSASFSRTVTMGDGTNADPNTSFGLLVYNDGDSLNPAIYSKCFNDAAGIVFQGSGSSGDSTSEIKADGRATFAGPIEVAGSSIDATSYFLNGSGTKPTLVVRNYSDGPSFYSGAKANNSAIEVFNNSASDSTSITMKGDGSASFAGDKCGFTSAGEIFFTSRNDRFRLVVQGELCMAEPYTREMELKEKAEQWIADKRETKPSDPLNGVTMDIDNSSPKQD